MFEILYIKKFNNRKIFSGVRIVEYSRAYIISKFKIFRNNAIQYQFLKYKIYIIF